MFNKRSFLLLFLLLIAIGSVSSVAASDINDDAIFDSGYDKIGVDENVIKGSIVEDNSNQISAIEGNVIGALSANDDSDDVLKEDYKGSSLNELQNMINKAAKGSTITLYSDFYADRDANYDGVLIDKALTINGNGHTIDAHNNARIFYITADNVVLKDLTFTNGYGIQKGGAICIEDCLTTINNCNFIKNTAAQFGGAIITSGELRITNCNFINNTANGYGGAIFANYPSDGVNSLNIDNSYFENNFGYTSGGALYLSYTTFEGVVKNNPAKTYIKNSKFIKNRATYGGALINFQAVDINNCQFLENYGRAMGGAIQMGNGVYLEDEYGTASQTFSLVIHGNSIFKENTASSGAVIRYAADDDALSIGIKGKINIYDTVTFESNSALGDIFYLVDSDSSIKNAIIKNNVPEQGSVMHGGTAFDCTFSGNSNSLTSDANLINKGNTKFTFKQSGEYYNDKTISVELSNTKYNTPLVNIPINVQFSNGQSLTLRTNSKGVATYDIPFGAGTYSATASVSDKNINVNPITIDTIDIAKAPITITPIKLSTTYDSGKNFQVKVVNTVTNKVVSGLKLTLKVYTGSKYITRTITTDANGIAKYAASKLSVATHKVIVSNGQSADATGSQKTSSIVISKATYDIVAPKVTNPYNVGNFKITVKNKGSGKVVSGVTLTVKIYTGNKAKTQTVKTNSKGIATISTKGLSKSNHKIVVSVKANTYFKSASKTSSAKIVAKASTSISYQNLTFFANKDWIDSNSFRSDTYGVGVVVVLKDANGNKLTKSVTIIHSDGYYNIGKSGELFAVKGGRPGTLTIKFEGDKNYKASSCTVKLGDETIERVYA